MFARNIPIRVMAERYRPAPVQLRRVAQRPRDSLEPLIRASVEQGAMELGVGRDPLIAESLGIFGVEL